MNIPLVDLKAQYRPLKDEILTNITSILDGMQLFLGPNVQAFEKEFAQYSEVKHAIGVSEGTTALQLALMAGGIGLGDEVITVSHTFIATAEAIALVGAKPVFVDIDPHTYTLDVTKIESAITPHTKAIIPVHLYGQPADMDPIMQIAARHNLLVIEDACQAHGAQYKGRRTGGLGHMAAYSFYFSKNLGAYGEGGMVTTNDDLLAEKIRILRDHGSPKRYYHEMVGINGRLDEIQASILRTKLPYLDGWNQRRRVNAERYKSLLSDVEEVILPQLADYAKHVFHLFVIRVQNRDKLLQHLRSKGVGAGIHYPIPCHLQPAFKSAISDSEDLFVTEQVASDIISLPLYPELTSEQQEYVANVIRTFFH